MCKFCNGSEETIMYTSDGNSIYIGEGGTFKYYEDNSGKMCLINSDSYKGNEVEINYCPMCGKKLKDENKEIDYEHLRNKLCVGAYDYDFNKVTEISKKYKVNLSDKDFAHILRLRRNGKDADWIIKWMSKGDTLSDVLVSYIGWETT